MDVHAVAWVHRGPAVNDRALHLGARTGQAWTTRRRSSACASGVEGRRPPLPGTAPASGRRCAAGTTREGLAYAPPWGDPAGSQRGEAPEEIRCTEKRHVS
jgi:hypothetical protein